MLIYEEEVLIFFGQNWYTIEISVFDFSRNLFIVSINYDIYYEEKVYDILASIHKTFIGCLFNFDFRWNWHVAECFDSISAKVSVEF